MTGVRFDGNTSVVSVVIKGGPADRAGIKVGDEIVSAGDLFVVQAADLVEALKEKKPGDVIKLEILRGGKFRFFELELINAAKGDVEIGEDGKVSSQDRRLGITDELAPALTADQWWDVPDGLSASLRGNRGKVVCMLFFQADCVFSKQDGLPELKEIQKAFADDDQVVVLAVHTPFQSFEFNTFGAARTLLQEVGVSGPMGHDKASAEKKSATFKNYKAPGTPWFVVVDKQGIVRYNDSSLPLAEASLMFGKLKAGQTPEQRDAKSDAATESAPQVEKSKPRKGRSSQRSSGDDPG